MECLQMVLEDTSFEKLKLALDAKNVKEAFDCAHTLKGVLGNVGLTPLYEKTIEIVEPLRKGDCEGLTEKIEELIGMRNRLSDILTQ